MEQNIFDGIKEIEKTAGKLSSAQKILLTTDGSVTAILDVLKGHVDINTLVQEFIPADEEMAKNLDIEKGETVNYRVVVIRSNEPLIYAMSLVPLKRLDNDFKEDLIRADIPIGRILKKHNIESRREIKSVYVEDVNEVLSDIFKTTSPMLSRTYNIIHHDEILIWLKETFPYSLFRE
ncbi:MAG: Chorismate pyruvate-lyase [Methanobacterium sp. PtaU1.Bin242]|nr:MAG: Chorismate pyruvate-lyase [Methanobacterium sp. PtaU1.Bin242]